MLVGGCTSADEKDDYIGSINEIQERAIATYDQTVNSTPSSSAEQRAQLEEAAGSIDTIVSELNSIEVPEEAEDGHAALIDGYERLKKSFDDAAAEVESAESDNAFSVVTELAREGAAIGRDLDSAIAQLRRDLDTQ